ncbi:2-oxoisovalerate dehydrogenase E2 component (dihydrolipoyl transacylase) [Sphingomonas kaistensis]|uniref:Dihydrolipoamide acetyltransferase component of pyruvate dehydrogenase complex n=1 Tax=Sphingomonas kaistensis TaxID=298708 RepID=A0A7X5Y8C3_9SPHN|nr:dihydrolipoamide acetyltransferase family protein [Sphingomonas kaistensis]NJC06871.1 2-oxoisovalerate dehydrogenase E2 component (dihydrolipoyl transacylase) [Sphingomonas kaistensis]
MATYLFKLPDIGEGIAEAEIVAWHIKVGDRVEEDQQLADMMTDKATVEMESPVAGVVRKLAGEVGDQIAIGSVLVEIETEGADTAAAAPAEVEEVPLADGAAVPTQAQEEANPTLDVADEPAPAPAAPAPQPQPDPVPAVATTDTHKTQVLTTPAVRARARDLGIDLGQVKHQGEHIRHADLDAYLLYNGGQVSGRGTALRADEQIKVVGLRRKIAENMQAAKRRIPHFALVEEYDVTALEETRAMMNRDRGSNPKLTLLPFLITALNKALADFSMINATYDDEANVITRHGSVHMGMAAQTPNGLMVPVIRNAERLSIWQLATEVARLSDAAKTGKATREELSNPTFTISSLGPMGGVVSTPVISPPQVATIAVNKVEEKVVPVNGELEIRKRMNLSLSCDHRVVDGWDAASFLASLKPLIENPLRLLA